MENQEKTQQTNEVKILQCGCFRPSSKLGKMMMKTMRKMCGLQDNKEFNCNSMMSKVNCCYESK